MSRLHLHLFNVSSAVIVAFALVAGCSSSGVAPPGGVPPSAVPLPSPAPVPTNPGAGQSFLMNGVIKDVGSQGILVEGLAGGDACWVSLPPQIQVETEYPDGTTNSASTQDLVTGLSVSVWHDGPILESYPCQTSGSLIKIYSNPDAEGD